MITPDENQTDLQTLITTLRQRHNNSVCAVLFYGSCMRSGDLYDGIVDIYLVVNSYQHCYGSSLRAAANYLLPPNVFYAEIETTGGIIRSKYAIISKRQLSDTVRPGRFESYFWGRFCQPIKVAWCLDHATDMAIQSDLQQATRTLLLKSLPKLPPSGAFSTLWTDSLKLSYGAELRTERGDRGTTLFDYDREHYQRTSTTSAQTMPYLLRFESTGEHWQYHTSIPAWRRLAAKLSWPLRELAGKGLSILRLVKALFTFEGGLDYIIWKLERHSGQSVELSARARRWPLLFIWGDMWRLYRRGVFR